MGLPTEIIEAIFKAIQHSGFRQALTPTCSALLPLYDRALYYDIELFTDEIPKTVEICFIELGFIKISSNTYHQREGDG